MIIKQNGKLLTQGAVILAVTEPDQWTIRVAVAGPAPEGSSPQIFELLFSHDQWNRMLHSEPEPADCILTMIYSAAEPGYVAYSVDPRGAAGLKVFIQRKAEDPNYQAVHSNDYVMHARRYGFDALRFVQIDGLFTLAAGKAEGERLRRIFLEGKK